MKMVKNDKAELKGLRAECNRLKFEVAYWRTRYFELLGRPATSPTPEMPVDLLGTEGVLALGTDQPLSITPRHSPRPMRAKPGFEA